MKLWTIQPNSVLEKLEKKGRFFCDAAFSEGLNQMGFHKAYNWMAEQMYLRIGPPSEGVRYPLWAWYALEGKSQKPDLRRTEFRHYTKPMVCIECELADWEVLLSDEELWHYVLNEWYLDDSRNEEAWRQEEAWFDALPNRDQDIRKRKSWEKIFTVSPPFENDWTRCGFYVQATFWELKSEQVKEVRYFNQAIRK